MATIDAQSNRFARTVVLIGWTLAIPAVREASAQVAAESATYAAGDAEPSWDRFYLQTSLVTEHFSSDAGKNDHQHLINGEWRFDRNWLAGVAFFDNSYNQSSQYLYAGWRFEPMADVPGLYIKVSAGVVHGYSGQYRDKIPLNHSGFAPTIAPAVGYCYRYVCSELVVFWAGAMLTLGVSIP